MNKKRIIALLLSLSVLFSCLAGKIYFLDDFGGYVKVANQGKSKTISVSETRGRIYDRNMNLLVNNQSTFYAILKPSVEAIANLGDSLSESEYIEIYNKIQQLQPLMVNLKSPLVDTEDMKILEVFNRYGEITPAPHLIGYLDAEKKNGVSGIEKSFNDLLNESRGSLSATFTINGLGKVLEGETITVNNNNYNTSAGISLTLDSELQKILEEILRSSDIKKGAAVILDVETGALLASVSLPEFDPNDLASSLENPDSPFINRVLTPYSVGSVYKPIVAIAALEAGIEPDYMYKCMGKIKVGNVSINCHNHDGHGLINMSTAIAQSCNCYFIDIAQKIGGERIVELSNALGLGQPLTLAEAIISQGGKMPELSELKNSGDLANLSFGQGALLATPLQMAAIYNCFANDGIYKKPYLLNKIVDENKEITAEFKPDEGVRIIKKNYTELLKRMMIETVETGSGKNAKPIGTSAAGKTATAQSGWYKDSVEVLQTWFAGYFPAEKPKYTIVIMREDGNSPTTDCAPVFRRIAEKIISLPK